MTPVLVMETCLQTASASPVFTLESTAEGLMVWKSQATNTSELHSPPTHYRPCSACLVPAHSQKDQLPEATVATGLGLAIQQEGR